MQDQLLALQTHLANGKKKSPELKGRFEKAGAIIVNGGVKLLGHLEDDTNVGVYSVESQEGESAQAYTSTRFSCDCKDFRLGRAKDNWCKHRLAVRLHESLQSLRRTENNVSVEVLNNAATKSVALERELERTREELEATRLRVEDLSAQVNNEVCQGNDLRDQINSLQQARTEVETRLQRGIAAFLLATASPL